MEKNDLPARYSVIIPVFNEEAVIGRTYRRLKQVMDSVGDAYELLFVNDGSRDASEELIRGFAECDASVKLISFSRNFGHQIAITAGMDYAEGDAVIIIDADLQDPPELIPLMLDKWREGFEVVYAKRTKRHGESLFKKATARLFYRLLRYCTDISIPVDTGDFRLMDRKACDQMKQLREQSRFVRGMVSWIGFRQTAIEYERDERLAGETKYPLKRMLKLSLDGITSFSLKPIKLAGLAGAALSLGGLLYGIVALYMKLFTGMAVAGWNAVAVMQLLFTGFILMMLAVTGEYIGRIYEEAKGRPLYIVRQSIGLDHRAPVAEHGAETAARWQAAGRTFGAQQAPAVPRGVTAAALRGGTAMRPAAPQAWDAAADSARQTPFPGGAPAHPAAPSPLRDAAADSARQAPFPGGAPAHPAAPSPLRDAAADSAGQAPFRGGAADDPVQRLTPLAGSNAAAGFIWRGNAESAAQPLPSHPAGARGIIR